jgi:PBSX family phage terminase large subunit
MDDNPSLDPEYVASQKKLYTGVFYERMILGHWNFAKGAIYAGAWGANYTPYDDVNRPPGLYNLGRNCNHYIGIDYGTTNPCVFLDVIDDGTTAWYDAEYYWDSTKEMRQKTDAEYAEDLAAFIRKSNCNQPPRILIDPSAASFKAELNRRGGLWVTDANNEVLDGIRRTASALKQKKIRFHRGRCPVSIREHQGYAWDDKKAKLGVEEPIKQADHTCDAARYINNAIFKDSWRLAS